VTSPAVVVKSLLRNTVITVQLPQENLRKTLPYKQRPIFYCTHAPATTSAVFLLMIFEAVPCSAFGLQWLYESCNAFSALGGWWGKGPPHELTIYLVASCCLSFLFINSNNNTNDDIDVLFVRLFVTQQRWTENDAIGGRVGRWT
jgi:hypothetical protein